MVRRLSWEASVCEACLGGLFAPTTGSSLFWPRHGAPPRWGKPHAIMFVFPSTVDVFRTQSTWLAGKVPILGTTTRSNSIYDSSRGSDAHARAGCAGRAIQALTHFRNPSASRSLFKFIPINSTLLNGAVLPQGSDVSRISNTSSTPCSTCLYP